MPLTLEVPDIAFAPAASETSPRGELLLRVMRAIERAGIPYCILHGHEKYPAQVEGDVDLLVPDEYLPRKLALALHENREEIGARIVQWFEDGAHFIVLAGRDEEGAPVLLQLHVSPRYEMAGRVFFNAEEILPGQRCERGFMIPAPDVEFACVLVNKLSKRQLTDLHGARLSAIYARDPRKCREQAERILGESGARMIATAAAGGDWHTVQQSLAPLREELLRRAGRHAGNRVGRALAKVRRWMAPRNGLHVVFLGPDGVGKSTAIESFQREVSPAFLHSTYLTFAPGLLPGKLAPPKPNGPHSLPARSLPASLLKAAWWAVCYTAGYFASVYPTLARGGLVVNHRYLIDAIVDQKRYRYGGPVWLLRCIWAISPKPDMVVLLDAPPEIIQLRKQEVAFEETSRQVRAYRDTIGALPIGKTIDASQSAQKVAADAQWLALDFLASRVDRQFGWGGMR